MILNVRQHATRVTRWTASTPSTIPPVSLMVSLVEPFCRAAVVADRRRLTTCEASPKSAWLPRKSERTLPRVTEESKAVAVSAVANADSGLRFFAEALRMSGLGLLRSFQHRSTDEESGVGLCQHCRFPHIAIPAEAGTHFC